MYFEPFKVELISPSLFCPVLLARECTKTQISAAAKFTDNYFIIIMQLSHPQGAIFSRFFKYFLSVSGFWVKMYFWEIMKLQIWVSGKHVENIKIYVE